MTDLEVITEEATSNLAATVTAAKVSSNAQGGLRESEVWLAGEPERKAAAEAERRRQAALMEAQAEAEAAQFRAQQAQTDYDNTIKLEMLKAMTAPRVITLQHHH